MRITAQMFPSQLEFDLTRIKGSMDTAQTQISSGQRVRSSSDDPAAYRRAESLQVTQIRTQQWRQNIANAKNHMSQDYTTSHNLQNIVSRASEIATRTTGGVFNNSDLQAEASEVNSLIENAVTLANKQYNGQFLYGGTGLQPTDDAPVADGLPAGTLYKPFVVTRDPITNQVTGVAYSAGANQGLQNVEIEENSTIPVNTVGANPAGGSPRGLFMNGAAGSATDVFTQLINLRDHLAAGNVTAVQTTDLPNFQQVEQNVTTSMGLISANLSRLNTADAAHTTQLQSDEQTLSTLADTDLASAVFQLTQSQTAFQAALQVGAQTLNLSILNYLK
jgi:flagellar hook-associated protein 3 FlgL